MPYGIPRSDRERRIRHLERFGTTDIPQRQGLPFDYESTPEGLTIWCKSDPSQSKTVSWCEIKSRLNKLLEVR